MALVITVAEPPLTTVGQASKPDDRAKPTHYRHIDGLRAIAVLAVMIFHLRASWLPGGFAGVDVFFVISGFVVTNSLIQHSHEGVREFIGGFYARRLARIVPPLLAMLVLTSVASMLFIPRLWITQIADEIGSSAFLGMSNVTLGSVRESYYSPRLGFIPFTHTWSLGVEEQFYLVVPLLLLIGIRIGRSASSTKQIRLRWPAFILMVPTVWSLQFQAVAQATRPLTAFYSVRSRFWEMAVGALLALAIITKGANGTNGAKTPGMSGAKTPWIRPRHLSRGCVVGGTIGLLAAFVFLREQGFPWPTALIPVMATLLLIGGPAWTGNSNHVPVMTHRSMIWVGKRSYSLYLWHWPVIVLMRWTVGIDSVINIAAAVAISFGLTEVSYRLLEQSVRLRRTAPASRWKKTAAFVCVTLVSASGAAKVTALSSKFSFSTVSRHADRWFPNGELRGREGLRRCQVRTDNLGWATTFTPSTCAGAGLSPRQLFVLGDSHALQYRPSLHQLSAELGITVTLASVPGCAYVNLLEKMICGDWVEIQQRVLKQAHPGDLIFLASLRSRRLAEIWSDSPDTNFESDAVAAMESIKDPLVQQRLTDDATKWIQPFSEKGLHVVFSLPSPVFRSPTARCSDWFNRTNSLCRNGFTIDRRLFEQYRSPVLTMVRSLERRHPQVSSWDPLPALCPDVTCSAFRSGDPTYSDGDHLSAAGNELVFASLSDSIAKLIQPEASDCNQAKSHFCRSHPHDDFGTPKPAAQPGRSEVVSSGSILSPY
jgi:peptidoglycan/LPS O-acetylase OafA/YrhL